LGTNSSDLPLPDRRLWSFQNSRLRNSQISNFTSLEIHRILPRILLNQTVGNYFGRSDDRRLLRVLTQNPQLHATCSPDLTVQVYFRRSDSRRLLRVLTRNPQLHATCSPDLTVQVYFGRSDSRRLLRVSDSPGFRSFNSQLKTLRVISLESTIHRHVVKYCKRTHGPIRRVTHVTSYLTFQSSACSKLTNTWCTSHVSMSSPVTSASHVTSEILGSTSPPGDIIVPHHFGSSGFGTSGVSTLAHFQFSQTLISRTGQTVAMCLPYQTTHINPGLRDFGSYHCKDQRLQFLRAFGLRKTQTSTFFRNVFIQSSRSTDMCFPWIDDYDFFGSSYFENSTLNLHFSPKCMDFCHMSSWIGRLQFTSDLWGPKISILNFSLLTFSRVLSPGAHDRLTRVLLQIDSP
jgi:hypothetical protein